MDYGWKSDSTKYFRNWLSITWTPSNKDRTVYRLGWKTPTTKFRGMFGSIF